jgi:hypothetical protein
MVEQLYDKIIQFFTTLCDDQVYALITNSDYKFDGTYSDFIKHNISHIKSLDTKELTFLSKLVDLITEKKLNMVDPEDFVEHKAVCFYYNKDYKLVLVHED